MKLNFWLKASQLFFVYVLLLLAGSLCKHVFFLLFLLCAFHAFIFAVLRYVQPPPLQLPVSSHHIRITDADDLDLPWLLQKELDWKEVLVQLSRHYSPAPSAEQRHTGDVFRCRAPSPSPKSHVCSITFVSPRCQLAPRHDSRPFGSFIGFFSCALCVWREFDLVPPQQRFKCSIGILRGMFKRFSFARQRLDIHKSIFPEAEKNFSENA